MTAHIPVILVLERRSGPAQAAASRPVLEDGVRSTSWLQLSFGRTKERNEGWHVPPGVLVALCISPAQEELALGLW